MSERRAAIVRLLETRDDNLPTPSRRDHAPTGFVHGQPGHVSCPDCLANDRVMFGCETCGGRGFIEERRDSDPYAVQKVQPFGLDGTYLERDRERIAQIARLESQTAPPRSDADLLAEANDHPYGWEIARRRMYDQFDYRELDRQLEFLRDADNGAYHALHASVIYRWVEPSAGYEAAVQRGLSFLDVRLPDPLRAPAPQRDPDQKVAGPMRAEAGATAKATRDTAMRRLADSGATPAQIAVEFRVSIRTVYAVVNEAA